MITINSYRKEVVNAIKVGVDEYLVKPYVEEEFQQKIDNILKYAD